MAHRTPHPKPKPKPKPKPSVNPNPNPTPKPAQAAELTTLGTEHERVVADGQRLRGEVVGLRGRAAALTEALEAAEVKLTEARRA